MKVIKILSIIIFACFMFIIVFNAFNSSENKKYDIKFFALQIKNKGYLITAEMEYPGRIRYKINENVEDDKWLKWLKDLKKFLVYREFMMIFNAKIEAGVDLSDIDLIETESKIIVKMPHATIKDIYIIPESVEYYDVDKAPIEWGESDKDAANNAKIKAKEYVKRNVIFDTLLDNAQRQAEKYVESFLKAGGTYKDIEFDIVDNNEKQEETYIELIQQSNEQIKQAKELDILQIVNDEDNIIKERSNFNIEKNKEEKQDK